MTSWVRLWSDMPTDPKWRVIAKKSGRPLSEVLAVFMHMMTNAGSNANERGELLRWSDEDVAAALDVEVDAVADIRAAMQGKTLEGDKLKGWEKRQPRREDGSAERAKEWRERKRTQANVEKRPEADSETDSEQKTPVNARSDVDELHRQAYLDGVATKAGKVAKSARADQRTKGELDGTQGITFARGKLTVSEEISDELLCDFPTVDVAAVCDKAGVEITRMSYPTVTDAMAALRRHCRFEIERKAPATGKFSPPSAPMSYDAIFAQIRAEG